MNAYPSIAILSSILLFSACAHNDTDAPTSQTQADSGIEVWPQMTSPIAKDPALEQRIDAMLAQMSIEEKVGQMTQGEIQRIEPGDIKKYHLGSVLNGGGSFPNRNKLAPVKEWLALAESYYQESMDTSDGKLAIPISWGSDAVHGHNNVIGATIFPHNIGLGATRNDALLEEIGAATAREVLATGIDWVFAPTVAVAQNDLWGRTYESYSEDPQLVASLSKALTIGMQGKLGTDEFLDRAHVVATAKHFLGDGGTVNGDDQGDAIISEKELSDIHNAGYITTLDAGVQTVMASFSSWNGVKMHGNKYLLTDVLKERMGFDGFVVGDWNGHAQVKGCTKSSCPQSIIAGVDMMMVPYDWKDFYETTVEQVKQGLIPEERINDAVRRILRVKLRAGLFELSPSQRAYAGEQNRIGHPEHRAIARQAVRESLVLLKNNGILPLRSTSRVLVAGDGADNITKQSGGWTITWQGTGNTNSEFPGGTSIYWGLKTALEQDGGKAVLSVDGSYQEKPDVAVVVFGEDPYAEGHGDRDTLEYQPGTKNDLALLKKFNEAGIPVVAVFISGRPMWVNPELNASDAFVAAWLPGTEAGGIADVLIGDSNGNPRHDFKGKLSFSWPRTPVQAVLNPVHEDYDPLFRLGYGLTYRSKILPWQTLPETGAGVADKNATSLNYFVKRITQPWLLHIHSKDHKQILSGPFAVVRGEDVRINTTDKDVQEDALLWTWDDTELAEVRYTSGPSLDISPFYQTGAVVMDLKVNRFDSEQFDYYFSTIEHDLDSLDVDPATTKAVSLLETVRGQIGKDWFTVRVPLRCFTMSDEEKLSIRSPLNLRSTGTGTVAFANIRIETVGHDTAQCPK